MIVIDASTLLEILSGSSAGRELALSLDGVQLHAPHLIDLEVLNAIRKWTFGSIMSQSAAEQALTTFRSLEITRHAHTPNILAIWALRHNLTAYDASYLALARALDAELLTMDSGLRKMAAKSKPN